MAAPSYTTDLADISTAESATGWAESTAWGAGKTLVLETDFYIQGSNCISEALKTGIGSLIYDFGQDATAFATGDVAMTWHYCWAPNAMDVDASGGMRAIIGSGINDFNGWSVAGSDTLPYGGWICVPIDPDTNDGTPDYSEGTPGASLQFFGHATNLIGEVSKGNSHGVDVIRYGRAEAIFRDGDSTNGFATFAGFAAENDDTGNRWGLIQEQAGGYLWQGLITLGDSTGSVDFRDSNVAITINNTKKVTSGFNKIEINDATSRVDWDTILITALGTLSRGALEVVDNADVNFDDCIFTDMSTFIFQADSTVNTTTFRRCDQVTTGTGEFNTCLFDESVATAATIMANLSDISDCSFVSDGTSGYAVELTSLGGGTMTWDNNDVGYAGTDGTTGDETIHVDSTSGSLTINVAAGYTTPTIHSEGATVSVVAGQVTTTITVQDVSTSALLQDARVYLLAGAGGPLSEGTEIINDLTDVNGEVSDTRALASDQPVTGYVRRGTSAPLYKQANITGTIDNGTGLDLTIQMISDE